MTEIVSAIAFILSACAAVVSFLAIRKANDTAEVVKEFQINSFLNKHEIELINKALEKLNIYNVWCKANSLGEKVNYNESEETEYESRDNAEIKIPQDVKLILIQVCAHSEELEDLIKCWEEGFIIKVGNYYSFNDDLVSEKIRSLRTIRCSLL